MGSPVLLLRLEAPLQSWGGRSRWDVRDTEGEPTKSAIVGLLGAAFGYERGNPNLLELDKALRFGVRVEAQGRILKDYQTITGVLRTAEGKLRGSENDPSTILSPRYYIEDGAFLVGFEEQGGDGGLLASCADALRNPVWTLFLGRKTCVPSRPILDCLTSEYDGLEDALRRHPWEWQGVCGGTGIRDTRGKITYKPITAAELAAWRLPVTVEALGNEPYDVLRQDALRLNTSRYYDFRPVKQMTDITRATVSPSPKKATP